jgi:4-amino-4-deoxy-L-arabinose transferase-like glycosyltransferase
MPGLTSPERIPRLWRWSLDERRRVLLVWLLSALGMALRLVMVHVASENRPDGLARLGGDESGYDGLARDILAGYGFTWPGRVPLYPLWLAGLRGLFGPSYVAITQAQAVVSAAIVPLTFALGRRMAGPTAGLIAAALAAVSFVLVRQPAALLSEVLFTPLVAIVTLTLWRALDQPSPGRAAHAGAWLGVANLVRPTLVLFPAVAVALFVRRLGWRRGSAIGIACAAATLLVEAPWMVHNARLGRPVWTLATSNGILWQGSPEYYHLTHDRGFGYLRVWQEVLYAPGDDAPDPGTVEGERYWRERAVASITREPLTYLRYAAEKSVTYWVGDANADWGDSRLFDYHAVRRTGFTRAQTVSLLTSRILLPAGALFALAILWRRRRVPAPILALLVYCTALHAATHAEARLSEPLQPLLFVLLAGAAVESGQLSRRRGADPVGRSGSAETSVPPSATHYDDRSERTITSSLSCRTISVVLRISASLRASPVADAIERNRALRSR